MTDEEYATWLASPSARRVTIVEAVASVAGVETTFYLSNRGYTTGAADTPANTAYQAVMAVGVKFTEALSLTTSETSLSAGDIEIHNPDGARDTWLNYIWTNRSVKAWIGDVRWARSDFRMIFNGISAGLESKARDKLSIKLRDKLQRLNTPLTEQKLGGTTPNKDEVIPIALGEVHNITPLLVDPTLLEYQGHHGVMEDFIEVRDNAIPVTVTEYLTTGKFRLSQQPAGAITVSMQGDKNAEASINYPTATQWRLKVTAGSILGLYLYEMQLRETAGVPQVPTGGTASASHGNSTAYKAFDGSMDSGSYWASAAEPTVAVPNYLNYTFATPKAIQEYALTIFWDYVNWANTTPIDFELQYFNGSAWVTADAQEDVVWSNLVPTQAFTLEPTLSGSAGTYLNTIGKLVRQVVTSYGKFSDRFVGSDIDTANFTAFESAHGEPVGLYVGDRTNVLDACRQLAASVGAQLSMSRLGLLRLLQVDLPAAGPVTDVYPYQMREHTLKIASRPEVKAAIKLGFCRNYTVQEGLQTTIPAQHKDLFETEWLTETAVSTTAQSTYRLNTEPVQQDTCLLRRVDATVEAERQRDLWSVQRTVFEFEGTAECLLLELGGAVRLWDSRFGLSAGVLGMVVSLTPDWENGRVVVQVLT